MPEDEELRKAAVESLHRKRAFKQYLVTYLVINAAMVVVWAVSGRGSFWPVWVFFGTTIALVFSGWNAYGSGNRPITDEHVTEEMRKFKGD